MKDKLAWIGVIVVAFGIVLPWATYSASLGGSHVGGGTIPGYQYTRSLLALAASVLGVLVGIKLSKRGRSLTLIVAGAMVLIVAGSALADLSGPAQVVRPPSSQLTLPPNAPQEIRDAQRRTRQASGTARISTHAQIGVFVTMIGGILVAIGGATGLARRVEVPEGK